MTTQNLVADYDPNVSITDFSMVEQLGDTALLGNWFVFLKAEWLNCSGMARLLELSSVTGAYARSNIIFRGKEAITLPRPTSLPRLCQRLSLFLLPAIRLSIVLSVILCGCSWRHHSIQGLPCDLCCAWVAILTRITLLCWMILA